MAGRGMAAGDPGHRPGMRIGYFLSSEEYSPTELVRQAKQAEQAGFDALWISDHFHPWNDAQGQSSFVWSVIGAVSQVCSLPITTAVTCPTVRTHPVVIAQAAATSAVLTGGRFTLGVGSGEALNEHVTGAGWPSIDQRLDMLEESVEIMRELWKGEYTTHRGTHYTVENARLYTLAAEPPAVYVSAFGPLAAALAGRIGDGLISTHPDQEAIDVFRENGGAGKPLTAGYKVCYGPDDDVCIDAAHDLWANSGLPGELGQVLPSPAHFEQASTLVTRESTKDSIAYGAHRERHLEAFEPYAQAGFDDVYISQMGGNRPGVEADGFFEFYADLLPELRAVGG